MSKTRFFKRNRRTNKTKKMRKYYGGQDVNTNINNYYENDGENMNENKETEGIFEVVGDKVADIASGASSYLAKKGLRLIGLQPIPEKQENMEQVNINKDSSTSEIIPGIDDITSGISNTASNIVANVNEVLNDPEAKESLGEAVKETAQIGEEYLSEINDNLSTPELKQEVKESLDNVADYSEIAIKAMDKPVDRLIDQVNESGQKIASEAGVGAIKVATDMAGAVPFVGAVIDVGRAVNDFSAASYDIFKAGIDSVRSIGSFVKETNKNINKLTQQKKQGEEILDRTTQSIDEFQNPNPYYNYNENLQFQKNQQQFGGKRKTRRLLSKKKKHTKRVRFSN